MIKDTQSNAIRYNESETQALKEMGIDLSNIKSTKDLSDELIKWIKETDKINPDLLDKLARHLNLIE